MDTTHIYNTHMYGLYALSALVLTVWLANVLRKNGRVFLREVFPDKHEFADATNDLLVVGFYLTNFGYALLRLPAAEIRTPSLAFETFAEKLGALLIALAVMHFFNLYVFQAVRRRALAHIAPPPIAPHMQIDAR